MPDAVICTKCLVSGGDVVPIRRFDETLPSGERVENYFTRNPYIEQQLLHTNLHAATALTGDPAVTASILCSNLGTAVAEQAKSNELDRALDS